MFTSIPLTRAPSVASLPRQHTIGPHAAAAAATVQKPHRPVFLLASENTGASSSSSITPQQTKAAQNLVNLVKDTNSTPTEAQLQDAVDVLLSSGSPGTFENPGPATISDGTGLWRTVHAPHINRMSSILGTKFSISYTLKAPPPSDTQTAAQPPQFYSNVRYESSIFGSGWLSASGRLFSNENDSVELRFDTFWVDEGGEKSNLRPFLTEEAMNAGDKFITAIGRVSFFEGLAKFPVLYLDTDTGVSVFRFPPLRSNITVIRQ